MERNVHMPLSRRHVIAGLTSSLIATACQGRDGSPASRDTAGPIAKDRPARTLSSLGVDRFSTRDQWRQLDQACRAAHEGGFDLLGDPDAYYRHDGPLSLQGVSFDGRGCTLGALSDARQVLRCIGSNFRIANLRLLGAARARTSDDWDDGLWIGDESHEASDFVVEDVTVDAVAPGRGVAAAGFMFNNAHRGRIVRPVVRYSFADGIHVTNGSSDLVFERPLSENTGDDGFAVVSYVRQRQVCRNIRATDGISRNSAARGFTVVGGTDVVYERPVIERSAAAGLYLYGEESFNTFGVARCRVTAPVIRGCVTGRGLPAGFDQGAITIGGRAGQDRVGDTMVARAAVDCTIVDPVIDTVGRSCRAAVMLHEFAVRPRITGARLSNVTSTNPGLHPNGFDIGGRDVTIDRPRLTDIDGLPFVLTRTASGTATINAPVVSGSRLRGGPVDSVIYAENAPGLTRFTVNGGRFARGSANLSISLLPANKIRLVDNLIR